MDKSSIMWQYIREETSILESVMESDRIDKVLEDMSFDWEAVYFVSHGSSYNAAVAVSDYVARRAGLRVYAATPSNFKFNGTSLLKEAKDNTLVIAISQTGTSRGVLEAVGEAKNAGFTVLGLTDTEDSPLEKLSDYKITIGCGPEESNAKTKGYSATILNLILFSLKLGLKKHILSMEDYQAEIIELMKQVKKIDCVREKVENWCRKNYFGKNIKNLYVLGYGMNFGTAMEGQLKLMETMCIPTMFNDIEEFSHGMHRSINKDSYVILLNTEHPLKGLLIKTFDYLKRRTPHVLLLNASEEEIEDDKVLMLPSFPKTESVLMLTCAIQVISVFMPELNGQDPNVDANNDYTEFVHTRV